MVARNQALDAQFHSSENPSGIEGVPLSSRPVNFDSSDVEQTRPLHTTGDPDRSYAQSLFGAAGPSGASTHPVATLQNDGRPTWGSLSGGRSPQAKETPHPAGACPPPLGSALIVLHGGGSKATPPCACGQDLQMQADEGVEATDGSAAKQAFGRGRAPEDVRRIAKRPASASQAATHQQSTTQHDTAPVRTRLQ
jgi:hypothetical protein